MNRKQFLILVIAFVLLGGAGLALFWQDIAAYRTAGAKIGAKLLPGFNMTDVAQIRLQDAKSEVTLVRMESSWRVRERSNYPANVQSIGDLLTKLADLKVVQSESVGVSLLPRLDLAAPGKSEGGGTLVEFKDAAGKTITSLLLGKIILKKDPMNPLPNAVDGVPAGRYVLVAGAKDTVIVVSDPLESVVASPGAWAARHFFKADRVKTLTVAGDGAMQWKITRDLEYSQWKFASGGGELDPGAAVAATNALGGLSFDDIIPDSQAVPTDKAITVTAETFDNLTYQLKIAKRQTGDDYAVSFSVSGEPAKQRVPEKGEKPADKERYDKDFAASLGALQVRIAREKALSQWAYVLSAKTLAPLLRDRAQLVAAKRR
ncbi:MAG: DUF4340 domain-containing protein [Burkholderiales bacterium]|nr:DUF4340 domain-containing protein [Burkholderiales bacterium]